MLFFPCSLETITMNKEVCQSCGLEKEHKKINGYLHSQCVDCDRRFQKYANRDAYGKPITVLENVEVEW